MTTKAHESKLTDREFELARVVAEEVAECGWLEALQREVAKARDTHVKQASEANAELGAWEDEARAAANTKAAPDRATLSSMDH